MKSEAIKTGISAIGSAVSGVASEMKALVTETAAAGDTIDKQSQKLGLSREAYQEWDYVLSQNGASISTLQTGMRTMTNLIDSAKGGTESAVESFERLGISIDDLNNSSSEEIFSAVVSGLQFMDNEVDRNALANDVLGRTYQQLLPLLNQTAEATDDLKQKAHDNGMVMSDEAVDGAVAMTDALDTLSRTADGLKENLMGQLLPGAAEVAQGLSAVIAGADGGAEQMEQGLNDIIVSIETIAPQFEKIATAIIQTFGDKAPEIIEDFIKKLTEELPKIGEIAENIVNAIVEGITATMPDLAGTAVDVIVSLANALIAALPTLTPTIVDVILEIVDVLVDNIDELIDAAEELIKGLADGLMEALPILLEKGTDIVLELINQLIFAIPDTIEFAVELCERIGKQLVNYDWSAVGASINGAIQEALYNVAHGSTDAWDEAQAEQEAKIQKYSENSVEQLDKMISSCNNKLIELNQAQALSAYDHDSVAGWISTAYENSGEEWTTWVNSFVEKYEDDVQLLAQARSRSLAAAVEEMTAAFEETDETAEERLARLKKELGIEEKATEEIADELEDTAEELAEAAEESAEEVDALQDAMDSLDYLLNTHQISEEDYYKQRLEALEKYRDEESEAWWRYYDDVMDYYDKLSETEKEEWESYAENLVDEIEKSADEVQSAIEKSKSDYLKSGTELGETITDTEGNERFILNDMDAESKALEKYRADMDKLKATGVSDAVISSVYDFDYDSGDRQKYIDELLGMTDEDREQYDKEYQDYLAEVQKTAEYDNQGSINALEAASDTALESLDKATEYYEVGYSMAQEYYKGMADALNEVGIYDTAGIMGKSDVYAQGEAGTAGSAAGNYISTDTVISISVAGSEIIRGTIDDYLRGNLISGGNNTYV